MPYNNGMQNNDNIHEELCEFLNALEEQNKFTVIQVLKETPFEITEQVYWPFSDIEGSAALSPSMFIRKKLKTNKYSGDIYNILFDAQTKGAHFDHLPYIYMCTEINGELFVIMEFIDGQTLEDAALWCTGSTNIARALFPQLCKAVEELHTRFNPPLIHRDLKPSNIIVSKDTLKLIDFGISRVFKEGNERDTQPFGTRSYAAPEQFGFAQTDERSDIYSLGMILYFMLTGKLPSPYLAGSAFDDDCIPIAVRPVLAKATAFDPANRYTSVSELRNAFCDSLNASQNDAEPKYPVRPKKNIETTFAKMSSAKPRLLQKCEQVKNRVFSSKAFRTVCHIWNYAVIALLIMCIAACIVVSVAPTEDSAMQHWPVWTRIFLYCGVALMLIGCAWAVLIRPVIPRRFSILHQRLGKAALTSVLLIALGIAIVLAVSFVMQEVLGY